MKTFTNYAPGPRGLSLKSGETIWIDPGKSVKVDADEVVAPLPDLGRKPEEPETDEGERITALEAENSDLKKQIAEQGDQIAKLTADLEKAAPKK